MTSLDRRSFGQPYVVEPDYFDCSETVWQVSEYWLTVNRTAVQW